VRICNNLQLTVVKYYLVVLNTVLKQVVVFCILPGCEVLEALLTSTVKSIFYFATRSLVPEQPAHLQYIYHIYRSPKNIALT
jgi:hypothetical protein